MVLILGGLIYSQLVVGSTTALPIHHLFQVSERSLFFADPFFAMAVLTGFVGTLRTQPWPCSPSRTETSSPPPPRGRRLSTNALPPTLWVKNARAPGVPNQKFPLRSGCRMTLYAAGAATRNSHPSLCEHVPQQYSVNPDNALYEVWR